jgi:hypothetical protein
MGNLTPVAAYWSTVLCSELREAPLLGSFCTTRQVSAHLAIICLLTEIIAPTGK